MITVEKKNYVAWEISLLFTDIAAHENHLRTLFQKEIYPIPKLYPKLIGSEPQLVEPSHDSVL